MTLHAALNDYLQAFLRDDYFRPDELQVYLNILLGDENIPLDKEAKNILTILTGNDESQKKGMIDSPKVYVKRAAGLSPSVNNFNDAISFEENFSRIQRATLNFAGNERGTSFYHHFKLLSALVFATNGNPENLDGNLTLVSGDFPGIQNVIYTITSDGATKGVRGRSFFLQLLTECTVRRILEELSPSNDYPLSMANVIYIAGSKFLILAPSDSAQNVYDLTYQINTNLLTIFQGDYRLVTASHEADIETILYEISEAQGKLKSQEARKKYQPFRDVLFSQVDTEQSGYKQVFGEQEAGVTNVNGVDGIVQVRCNISHREARQDEVADINDQVPAGSDLKLWVASEQRAFKKLAEDLSERESADNTPLLMVFHASDLSEIKVKTKPSQEAPYAKYLFDITRWSCCLLTHAELREVEDKLPTDAVIQLLNPDVTIQNTELATLGTRYLAVHTPLVTKEDADRFSKNENQDNEETPQQGNIRDFSILASAGDPDFRLKRLGYLRMDVDNLGQLFGKKLKKAKFFHLSQYMAASDALSMFFDGYLSELVGMYGDSAYLIYGGGDDLFIVGEWQVIPALAEQIHDEFQQYTASKDSDIPLTISAAINFFPEHFPFYRGAHLTGERLEEGAKALKGKVNIDENAKTQKDKDGIDFLGQSVNWSEWKTIVAIKKQLLELTEKLNSNSLLYHLVRIYHQWEYDRKNSNPDDDGIYWGRYMWYAAYQLTRMREKRDDDIQKEIKEIQQQLIDGENIRLYGIAARWAQFIRRVEN